MGAYFLGGSVDCETVEFIINLEFVTDSLYYSGDLKTGHLMHT